MATWRVGRKLGRTLYRNGQCVGMVDTPALAAEIVSAMTRLDEILRAEFTNHDLLPGCGGPYLMDSPGGPVCSCGRPSRHESGWCGRIAPLNNCMSCELRDGSTHDPNCER